MGKRDILMLLGRCSSPVSVWAKRGVPLTLLETEGERFMRAAVLALALTERTGLDLGAVLEEVLRIVLGESEEKGGLAKALVHLSTAFKAKWYAALGLDLSDVLKEEVRLAIKSIEGTGHERAFMRLLEEVLG